jgi:hypothetical protein
VSRKAGRDRTVKKSEPPIQLSSNRFGFEPEVTVKVAKLGCRIYELPISCYGRMYEEGKKSAGKMQ